MVAIPAPQHTTAAAVIQWRERTTPNDHRWHLGASLIGLSCERRLWYVLRWAGREQFDGRTLRMFDSGKREEPRVYEELRGIGCEVHADDGGAQYRVSALGGHFGGSMDGVVLGVPEAPQTWHVLEIKTHNDKSFSELQKKGVREAKPQHFDQMQTYMHLAGLDRALYYAVNKNTDALHIERVERDRAAGARLVEKARRVIAATVPPLRISEDPGWFECRFCPFAGVCHGAEAPLVNCRTCVHSTPLLDGDSADGAWRCERYKRPLPDCAGCGDHLYIPPMLEGFATPTDAADDSVTYTLKAGGTFANGNAPGQFRSIEIRAISDKALLADPALAALKTSVASARVVA
jgi:hypothetical protein